jgi:hypothetical protein
VIVHDFDFVRLAVLPGEADPPLIVDPNAVLAAPVSLQHLKTVARRDPEILEARGGMEVEQLAARHAPDRPEPGYVLVEK